VKGEGAGTTRAAGAVCARSRATGGRSSPRPGDAARAGVGDLAQRRSVVDPPGVVEDRPGAEQAVVGSVWGCLLNACRPTSRADVHADTSSTVPPSPRAAQMPVSAFVMPGPVVASTAAGAPHASESSSAANAAPDSCRQCSARMLERPSASHSGAIGPPVTT
jgi:hypothetical protein